MFQEEYYGKIARRLHQASVSLRNAGMAAAQNSQAKQASSGLRQSVPGLTGTSNHVDNDNNQNDSWLSQEQQQVCVDISA
eukprot:scaffold206716_cov45-Prasinocladus_malaysianus.AAC.1